jgi:hypothetical protein
MLHGTTLTNNQLTFTTTNWGTAQAVTVKAGQDNDASNDTATLTHTASGGDYATYGGRRRWVDLHRQAGHTALRHRHCHYLRTQRR